MSEEIKLPSELVDALNGYFDVWFKLYQTAEALESVGLYHILKFLGYWPVRAVIIVGVTRPRGLIEYEVDSCKFHLWFSREPEVKLTRINLVFNQSPWPCYPNNYNSSHRPVPEELQDMVKPD